MRRTVFRGHDTHVRGSRNNALEPSYSRIMSFNSASSTAKSFSTSIQCLVSVFLAGESRSSWGFMELSPSVAVVAFGKSHLPCNTSSREETFAHRDRILGPLAWLAKPTHGLPYLLP